MTSAGLRRAQLWEIDYRSSREAGSSVLDSIIATSGRVYEDRKLLIRELPVHDWTQARFLVEVHREGVLVDDDTVRAVDGLFGLIRTIGLLLEEAP